MCLLHHAVEKLFIFVCLSVEVSNALELRFAQSICIDLKRGSVRHHSPAEAQDDISSYCMVTHICMYVCMVITYSRVWINRIRLPILLVVS